MSTKLFYRKKVPAHLSTMLPLALKWVLQNHFGYPIHREFSNTIEDLAFLRGLRAAKIDGAERLIDLLECLDYGETIEVFEE